MSRAADLWDRVRARFVRADTAWVVPAGAGLRSDRFRLAREEEWRRLDHIVSRIEQGRWRGLRQLSDADVLDLPVLYRNTASALAVARETSLDAATLAFLEGLVQRAWCVVYAPRVGFWGWCKSFFGGGWSRAVRGMGFDIAIALVVMVAATVAGWLLVAADPEWYAALSGGEAGDDRVPGASREVLAHTLFGHAGQNGMSIFATYLISHNAQITILAFALGFAFGLPSLLLLAQNAGNLGAILWLFHSRGLTLDLVGWLSVHGTTELFAILLAGAAGLHVGRALAFPGHHAVLDAVGIAGRRAAMVMVGVVVMLLVAGMLEGFARQLIENTATRLAVGGAMLAFWLWYFIAFGRERAA